MEPEQQPQTGREVSVRNPTESEDSESTQAELFEDQPFESTPGDFIGMTDPPTSSTIKFTLYFDGGAEHSTPYAGYMGAALYYHNMLVWKGGDYLGSNKTNNLAEYEGLIFGVKKAIKLGIKDLQVCGDSDLVIRQLSGLSSVENKRLKNISKEAKELLNILRRFKLTWVPREENKEADAQATLARENMRSNSTFYDIINNHFVQDPPQELLSAIIAANQQTESSSSSTPNRERTSASSSLSMIRASSSSSTSPPLYSRTARTQTSPASNRCSRRPRYEPSTPVRQTIQQLGRSRPVN
jgi:ribonuclease HI